MMANTSEEWELSKENIQPIQQGRKQKSLKVALASHTEDLIVQQQQAFEHELRTYSGDDPLSVWCKYIKWVEQNFLKGGRDGHIKHLIEQCLAILKDEKKYFDDDRFIDIILKFASMTEKPIEVYDYMYSHSIGCKSAKFFINWSWELEQIGNLKKADEVLTDGFHRKAEPFEKIKSYREAFEIRLVTKIKDGTEAHSFESEPGRSAFTVLKPQKKNLAPVSRTGEAMGENKAPLLLRRQQPLPRSVTGSTKLPFKIYDAENIIPPLPIQSHSCASNILPTENCKENEQKPSKWNKVKVKSQNFKRSNEVNLGFQFHCDEDNELHISTPRSVPKVSNVLSVRKEASSPRMALFERPDPMKKPQYPKNKVYGGAVEFSLEEIRAAEWYDKKKKMEQEMLLLQQQKVIEEKSKKEEELQKEVENLRKQLELLQSNSQSHISKPCNPSSIPDKQTDYNNKLKALHNEQNKTSLNDSEIPSKAKLESNNSYKSIQNHIQSLTVAQSNNSIENNFTSNLKFNHSWTDTSENKFVDSTSYREAAKMVQELYNGTLCHSTDEVESKQTSELNLHFDKNVPSLSSNEGEENNTFKEFKNNLPFVFYQDPTEVMSNSKELVSSQNFPNKHNMSEKESCSNSKEIKTNIPFVLYQDPTETVCSNEFATSSNKEKDLEKSLHNKSPLVNSDCSEEDTENIPPNGYIQEKNKRELAGILEPSKNILFIPLEEQEELQDDSDNEDDYIYETDRQQVNETLIPPSNTEQFSAAAFFASTPCIAKNNCKKSEIKTSEQKMPSCTVNEPKNTHFAKENQNFVCKETPNVQQSLIKPEIKGKESMCYLGLPNVLSTIMETSAENYSKSSSSSSSVNLTKSSQFDPSSHFSGFRKYSKLEGCEPVNLSSVSEVSVSSDINSQDENIVSHRNQIMNCNKAVQNIQLHSVDLDPFDEELALNFIEKINIDSYDKMYYTDKSIKSIKVGLNIKIGNTTYRIQSIIAEGAYAKVYEADSSALFSSHSNEKVALKVCKNGSEWEFYVCCEIQKRLSAKDCLPDVRNSFMNVTSAVKYSDGIVLVNEYCSLGTLLDLVNFYKKQNSAIPELLVLYITYELLHIVSKLHEVNIIHGDIKPDNFLLSNNAFDYDVLDKLTSSTTSLLLIDFGRAIDLNLHPKGICFMKTLNKNYFKCTEMQDNKPWVFQLDWYGVLSCIHTMLFSEYMAVRKENGRWEIGKKFKRYWYTSLWEPLFNDLLNIPECYKEPDIKLYTGMIKSKLEQNSTSFINHMTRFYNVYSARKCV